MTENKRSFVADLARVTGDTPKRRRFNKHWLSKGTQVSWYDNNMGLQKQGIDGYLTLPSGHVLSFDHKDRETDIGDFFVEIWSSPGRPGWAITNKCDAVIIQYGAGHRWHQNKPQKLVIIRWDPFQEFFAANIKELMSRHHFFTDNDTYKSASISIQWSEIEGMYQMIWI